MSGGESKVQCYKEQYCIGTRNVRSINQGKLDVVKQEMGRVNTDILGISILVNQNKRNFSDFSELKWTGMGEFN